MTRGQLPQRAGSLGLNGGGAAAVVPPKHSGLEVLCRLFRLPTY